MEENFLNIDNNPFKKIKVSYRQPSIGPTNDASCGGLPASSSVVPVVTPDISEHFIPSVTFDTEHVAGPSVEAAAYEGVTLVGQENIPSASSITSTPRNKSLKRGASLSSANKFRKTGGAAVPPPRNELVEIIGSLSKTLKDSLGNNDHRDPPETSDILGIGEATNLLANANNKCFSLRSRRIFLRNCTKLMLDLHDENLPYDEV